MRTAQIYELIPALVTLSGQIADFERPSRSGYRVSIPSETSYQATRPFLRLYDHPSDNQDPTYHCTDTPYISPVFEPLRAGAGAIWGSVYCVLLAVCPDGFIWSSGRLLPSSGAVSLHLCLLSHILATTCTSCQWICVPAGPLLPVHWGPTGGACGHSSHRAPVPAPHATLPTACPSPPPRCTVLMRGRRPPPTPPLHIRAGGTTGAHSPPRPGHSSRHTRTRFQL